MAKKLTNEEVEKLHKMYLEGKTCEEIGKLTGHKTDTVSKYLKSNYNIIPRKKVDIDELTELVKSGKTTKECAEYFGVNPSAISFWKKKISSDILKITPTFSQEEHQLSHIQEQMILGSLLGDMNIGKPRKHHPTCRLALVHSTKQKELFMKKVEILGEFMGDYKEYNYLDNRTNNTYSTIRGNSKSHKVFNDIYNKLYINGVKTITQEYLDMIDHPIALAYWFMDDGTNSGQITTNCFSLKEVQLLSSWLKSKFNIETTIHKSLKDYTLYIKACSRLEFDSIICTYIIPSMKYKLKFSEIAKSVNSVNSGNTLRDLNTKQL